MAALPDIELSYGTDLTVEMAVYRMKYGDGNTQRAAAGVNSVLQKWRLVWEDVSEAEAEELREYFAGLKGVDTFEWTPFGQDTELKFITVSPFQSTPTKTNLRRCSIDAEQVFDL